MQDGELRELKSAIQRDYSRKWSHRTVIIYINVIIALCAQGFEYDSIECVISWSIFTVLLVVMFGIDPDEDRRERLEILAKNTGLELADFARFEEFKNLFTIRRTGGWEAGVGCSIEEEFTLRSY